MVQDVQKDKRILLGDMVIFSYSDSDGFGFDNGAARCTGRIVAKLTEECAIRTAMENGDYFLLLPTKIHKSKLDDPENPLNLFRFREGVDLEFEWGEAPDEPHLVVLGDYLEHWAWPGMRDAKELGICPRCGDRGYWKALALNCSWHGMFL